MLTRLVYGSRAKVPIDLATAAAILRGALAFNEPRGITGLLCCSRHHFLQVMEGPRAEVSLAFSRIAKDPRHEGIELVSVRAAQLRWFQQWSMGYVGLSAVTVPILEAAGLDADLAVDRLTEDGAIEALLALRPHVDAQTAALLRAA